MPTPRPQPEPLARPLYAVARELRQLIRDTGRPVPPYFSPYLGAMSELETMTDLYGVEAGAEVVRYALENMSALRGPRFTAIRAELRAALAHHDRAAAQGRHPSGRRA
jgi:hypothetical protein